MYELNSARTLKIGIIGSDTMRLDQHVQMFHDMLNDNIMSNITIRKNFTLETNIINKNMSYSNFNFIFYLVDLAEISTNTEIIHHLKNISENLCEIRNHLFIIINGCDDMEADDDGDLVFTDETQASEYESFSEKIDSFVNSSKLFDISRLSANTANIFTKIINDRSMVNLSETEINLLASRMIKKSAKLSLVDKKRELKSVFKKINIEDKLFETGYTDMLEIITKYFKPVYQKKIICKNYLYGVDKCVPDMKSESTDNIKNILDEITDIDYLKQDMQNDFMEKIQCVLQNKLEQFYKKCRPHIAIDSGLLSSIDAYKYHTVLSGHLDIDCIKKEFGSVKKIVESEIDTVNRLIVSHYNKEVEKIIDLDKISAAFKVFALKDKNNIIGLFEKMKSNPKIISENMERMDKWIMFVDTCIKLGISTESVISLIELVIIEKIRYNVDMTRSNRSDISVVYPHCLLSFLLKNLSVNFIFDKLYMFLSCSIRYSGRNIPEIIQHLTLEQYDNLLVLEYKLLELVK